MTTLKMYSKNIESGCSLKVAAGTTGNTGGDGSVTIVEFTTDTGGMKINNIKNGVQFIHHGDFELDAFIKALAFAGNTLKRERDAKQVDI